MNKALNIIFAGTPDFAARHLQALIDSSHNVVAVYSQPDRPAGRGKKRQASAVKQLALQHNIPVYQPESLRNEVAQQELAAIHADIMVVVAYGLMLPQVVLDIPPLGCLNVHGSLLPKWRGAAPIQRSIWAGDVQTGVTVMQMDKGLDTGDMLLKSAIPIATDDTSTTLYAKLAEVGPAALLRTLEQIHTLTPEKQDDAQVSHAAKLSKGEALIDWQMDAEQLARNVRAFNPWPMAFFKLGEHNIKVWQATAVDAEIGSNTTPGTILKADKRGLQVACGKGFLNITSLQLPGKKALMIADVLNGHSDWFTAGQQIQ